MQLNLFDQPPKQQQPPHSGPETSREAAEQIKPNGDTERPRRQELQKAGLIADSGCTRKTTTNRSAIVWILTKLKNTPSV